MAKPVFDAMYKSGTYVDRDGNEKGRYQKVGAIFQHEDGRMSMLLESIPVGAQAPVWVSFFPKDK